MDTLTTEEIAVQYNLMLQSVALINQYVVQCPDFLDPAEHRAAIDRNVRQLQDMQAKDFWTTEDMTPVSAAIATGLAFLA